LGPSNQKVGKKKKKREKGHVADPSSKPTGAVPGVRDPFRKELGIKRQTTRQKGTGGKH